MGAMSPDLCLGVSEEPSRLIKLRKSQKASHNLDNPPTAKLLWSKGLNTDRKQGQVLTCPFDTCEGR
jgi:hypothetical protein